MPGSKQAWPTAPPAGRRRCRGSGSPRRGAPVGRRRSRRRSRAPRAACARGTSNSAQQLVVPGAVADVEEQRARGVGRVGGVDRAAGQPPEQEACRSCRRRARPRSARARAPGTWSSSQAILVAGEIGVEQQAGPRGDHRLVRRPSRSAAQASAVRRSCQTMALWIGLPGRAVPDHRRLALVGDADARRCRRPAARPSRARRVHGRDDARRQISSGSCSTQPGCGKCCGELLLRDAAMCIAASKTIARRRRRALVDGEDVGGHGRLPGMPDVGHCRGMRRAAYSALVVAGQIAREIRRERAGLRRRCAGPSFERRHRMSSAVSRPFLGDEIVDLAPA